MVESFTNSDVVVIGAGAAGLMAAGRAAECGASVVVLEKTDGPGKKILVSGKSRCNLTNSADRNAFLAMYGPNGRFLHGAFSRFFRPELLAFFERQGLKTKLERGGRIFPVSDDARDVVGAFERYLSRGGVRTVFNAKVEAIRVGDAGFVVKTARGDFSGRTVVIATGGASWPKTGSTGDGYAFARSLGHRLVPLRPALVPLVVKEAALAKSMQGVSLRNVRATALSGSADTIDVKVVPVADYGRGEKKKPRPPVLESRFGEMLFTHFGLGGPIILLMSLAVAQALEAGPVCLLIDLKPAVARDELRKRLLIDLNASGKRKMSTLLKAYLPAKMIEPVMDLAVIDSNCPAHQITAVQREKLLDTLKALRFNIHGTLPLSRAIVTAGGVALEEINPKTLASKIVPGIYFCGEVLDIDADTGGYNLQAAFSTGYVAGESAARLVLPGCCARNAPDEG